MAEWLIKGVKDFDFLADQIIQVSNKPPLIAVINLFLVLLNSRSKEDQKVTDLTQFTSRRLSRREFRSSTVAARVCLMGANLIDTGGL